MEPRRSSEQPRHASRRSAALDGDRFTLRVKLLRGSGLPAADRNGASDPYVVLRAAERKWRSSTCPKTLEPVWNEECQLDWVSMPQLRWLRLEVFDQDLVGSDPLGDALVPLQPILARGPGRDPAVDTLGLDRDPSLAWSDELEVPLRRSAAQAVRAASGSLRIQLGWDPDQLRRAAVRTPSGTLLTLNVDEKRFEACCAALARLPPPAPPAPALPLPRLPHERLETCFETGDGHYLPAYNSCVHRKSLDKFDPAADYPLDLNVAPSQQLESVKRIWQSADFLISHDVFEHLEIPEIGMINLARLLRPGGALLWSAPLLKEEHGSRYGDWQRYTTQRVRKLVDCAGFEVVLMHGLGSPVASLAYLYGITPRELSISELTNHACDASRDVVPRGGESHNNLGCRLHRYTQLIAIVTKKTDVKFDSYMRCVMGSISARQTASWWPEAL